MGVNYYALDVTICTTKTVSFDLIRLFLEMASVSGHRKCRPRKNCVLFFYCAISTVLNLFKGSEEKNVSKNELKNQPI